MNELKWFIRVNFINQIHDEEKSITSLYSKNKNKLKEKKKGDSI